MKHRRSRDKKFLKRRRQSRLRRLKAAALSLGLATAWGAEAKADVLFGIEVTPSVTLSDAVVVFGNNVSTAAFVSLGDLPAGVTSRLTQFFPSSDDFNGEPEFFDPQPERSLFPGYFIAATYDEGGSPGVALTFPDDTPVQLMQEWADIFETSANVPFTSDFAEQEVVAAIQAGISDFGFPNEREFRRFQLNYGNASVNSRLSPEQGTLLTPIGQESTLIGFSTATFFGNATVTIVPEPSTFGMIACTLGVWTLGGRGYRE